MVDISIDIPNVPGVPVLPSYSANDVVLLVSDVVSALFGLNSDQWGIFLDGAQAFPYNSIVDFDYKQDWPVSDYPVEDGGFQSYDKVQLPFDVRMRVASGGTDIERQDLLNSIRDGANTLDLYDVVTPEITFSNCNITHIDWRRQSHNGVGLIIVDIWFVEIRITSTATFSNTKGPEVAGQQNTGSVSAQAPNQQIQQDFDSGNATVQ